MTSLGLPLDAEAARQVRRIELKARRAVSDLFAGRYESVFKGQGMEFREVREYAPGDDVRVIDWNVTARTGKPHVKILAEERELTVMLLVDASGSGHFGGSGQTKNELAVELCALLAAAAIHGQDKVGLVMFTGEVELYIRPARGRSHVLRLIREALCFRPHGVRTNIPAALYFLSNIAHRRTVTFILSDFMADNYAIPLSTAARRHDITAVVIDDPHEYALPDVGWLAVADSESGRESVVNTSDPVVRQAYAQAAEQRALYRK